MKRVRVVEPKPETSLFAALPDELIGDIVLHVLPGASLSVCRRWQAAGQQALIRHGWHWLQRMAARAPDPRDEGRTDWLWLAHQVQHRLRPVGAGQLARLIDPVAVVCRVWRHIAPTLAPPPAFQLAGRRATQYTAWCLKLVKRGQAALTMRHVFLLWTESPTRMVVLPLERYRSVLRHCTEGRFVAGCTPIRDVRHRNRPHYDDLALLTADQIVMQEVTEAEALALSFVVEERRTLSRTHVGALALVDPRGTKQTTRFVRFQGTAQQLCETLALLQRRHRDDERDRAVLADHLRVHVPRQLSSLD